jgi:hypothetical protein
MSMPSKIVLAVLGLCLASAGPALAQEGPIASAPSTDVDAQIRAYLDGSPSPLPAADGPTGPAEAPPVFDKAPHGEVGVGIGSNGYRNLYASTIVPVGDIGTAAVAVSDTRFNGRFGGQHKLQSLSVAVALGDAASRPPVLACNGERLVQGALEPMWVKRMRAGQTEAALACPTEARR